MATRSSQSTVRPARKAVSRRSSRLESSESANGDRRQAILEAAITEFSAKGFSGARVDAIARRARSNKQLIYYYFDSKVGLYDAVLGQLIARSSERMDVGDPHPSLSAAVQAHVDRLLGQGGEEWIRFWLWEALEAAPRGKARDVERARAWARWVSDFERAQEHGEISERFDAKMLALALNSIIVTPYMTPIVTKLITGMEPDSDAFKREQLTLVRNLLESLASSASCQHVDGDL
jgi:TetR/AcrR family transcriptional regulator